MTSKWDFLPPLTRAFVIDNDIKVDGAMFVVNEDDNAHIEKLLRQELMMVPGIGKQKAGQIMRAEGVFSYAGSAIRFWLFFVRPLTTSNYVTTEILLKKKSATSARRGTNVRAFTKSDVIALREWVVSWPHYRADAVKSNGLF